MYSISDLERISGIKAHTIRIWEKRYDLLDPSRTKGNHRLYSDDDLIKLLNVGQLIGQGIKISNIAQWERDQIQSEVREVLSKKSDESQDVTYYNNEWLQSALDYNESKFYELYHSLRSKMDFMSLWENYLVPALQNMGRLWLSEDIAPAEEHFFSQLVRRKIIRELDDLPLPDVTGSPVLLFLPPNEFHELGLLVTEYLLRLEGVDTVNLGADLPIENINKIVAARNVKTLVSFIHGIRMDRFFLEYIIARRQEDIHVILNGRLNEEDAQSVAGQVHIFQPQNIQEFRLVISENLKWTY